KFDSEAATSNAIYNPSENSIIMDPRLVDDSQTMYRTYTTHVLNVGNPKAQHIPNLTVAALHEALADYLTCSYEGTPKLGVKFVQSIAKNLPSDTVQLGYLRNLQSTSKIVSETETDPLKTEPHKAGEAWAAALWEVRSALGCSPDVAQCEKADRIMLAVWASPWLDQPSSSKTVGQRFAQAIIEAIAGAGTAEEAKQARSIFQRRGLELP